MMLAATANQITGQWRPMRSRLVKAKKKKENNGKRNSIWTIKTFSQGMSKTSRIGRYFLTLRETDPRKKVSYFCSAPIQTWPVAVQHSFPAIQQPFPLVYKLSFSKNGIGTWALSSFGFSTQLLLEKSKGCIVCDKCCPSLQKFVPGMTKVWDSQKSFLRDIRRRGSVYFYRWAVNGEVIVALPSALFIVLGPCE